MDPIHKEYKSMTKGSGKPPSKFQRIVSFVKENPHMKQAEVRKHFDDIGVKVSSSEVSMAYLHAGLRRKKPNKPRGTTGKVMSVPVSESPTMASEVSALRKRNDKLRKVIDLLLDEEVDVLLSGN